jgi:tetratricopeptide (TPR) repeat protein
MRPLRRLLLVLFLLLALGLAGVLIWKRWHTEPMPPPPEVNLDGLDPDLREAIQSARTKVIEQPRSAEAWGLLGKLFRTPDFNVQASFCFAQAEKLEPNKIRWPYLQGEAVMLEDPEAALPHLRRAVAVGDRTEPDNVVPRLRLAEVLLNVGQYDEADACLNRAQEIDPDNPNIRFDRSLIEVARGNYEEGGRLLLSCQYSEFTRQKACHQLAALYERMGKSTEAAKFQQKAREYSKDLNWADQYIMDYKQLGVGKQARFQYIDRLESQGKYSEAVEKLQELLANGPDYRAFVGLGKNLGYLGDLDGAEGAFGEAIKLLPNNAKAHYYLSRIYLARGEQLKRQGKDKAQTEQQFQAAAESARKVLSLKPDDAMAHVALGLALKHLGQPEKALEVLRTAVQSSPDHPEPHFHLAEALAEAGEEAEARTHFQQVVQLAKPDDPHRKTALERLNAGIRKE